MTRDISFDAFEKQAAWRETAMTHEKVKTTTGSSR